MKTKIKYQINKNRECEEHRDKLLRKQNDRYVHFKELLTNYVELENRLKFLQEKSYTKQIEN